MTKNPTEDKLELPTKHACCGCSLCAEICPTHCITMIADKHGFQYPRIDAAQCLHCNLCKKFCPENQERKESLFRCFYGINNAPLTVKQSSSGGIFFGLALRTLAMGGQVVGAIFTPDFQVRLQAIHEESELHRLLCSKYVQASIPQNLFKELQSQLSDNVPILFSGTPCQIAAFCSFLKGKKYSSLTLCEIICHGVPSPRVWQSYLEHVAKTPHIAPKIDEISFRDKGSGWHTPSLVIRHQGKTLVNEQHGKNPYMRLFVRNVILRPSCADCQFKAGKSGADISLGDFWSLNKVMPELDNNTGASMILTHTPKGLEILQACNAYLIKEMPCRLVKQCNPFFFKSAIMHFDRERYFATLCKKNYKWFNPKAFSRIAPKKHGIVWKTLHRLFKSLIGKSTV